MGIRVMQGWGMTESSPVVTLNAPKPACLKLEGEAQAHRRCAQGRVLFGTDVRAVDDDGSEVPWDGKTQGAHGISRALDRQRLLPHGAERRATGFPPAMSGWWTRTASFT